MTGAEWQPIETAPKDGTDVLAVMLGQHKGKPFIPTVSRWDSEYECWVDSLFSPDELLELGCGLDWTPTHWMPLPEPPK